jgi:flagellar assembly protein FliH/type III secretion protein L
MSVERARVIKASAGAGASHTSDTVAQDGDVAARLRVATRLPAVVVDARAEAARIVAEARAKAAAIVAEATASAGAMAEEIARDARETALARLAAEVLVVRSGAERRAERELDHTIQIAVLLAERLVGEAIAVEPARLAALAEGALKETRGARQLRIETCPDDVAALSTFLAPLGEGAVTIEANAEMSRGSLVVHTELGRVDARLTPQLSRLAEALREVLRGSESLPQQGGPQQQGTPPQSA